MPKFDYAAFKAHCDKVDTMTDAEVDKTLAQYVEKSTLCSEYVHEPITVAQARDWADTILDTYSEDPEAAHGMEDAFLAALVTDAAAGVDISEPAKEAVRVLSSDRVRWYA